MTIPERDASAYVYFYHRPNMNLSAGGVKVWDPSGSSEYDCLGYDWNRTQALPKGADMFDFTLDNGLSVHMIEPFTEFRISHRGAFEVDLTWRKAIDPYLFGMNAGLEGWTGERSCCGAARATAPTSCRARPSGSSTASPPSGRAGRASPPSLPARCCGTAGWPTRPRRRTGSTGPGSHPLHTPCDQQ
jgi:hypothetical protein